VILAYPLLFTAFSAVSPWRRSRQSLSVGWVFRIVSSDDDHVWQRPTTPVLSARGRTDEARAGRRHCSYVLRGAARLVYRRTLSLDRRWFGCRSPDRDRCRGSWRLPCFALLDHLSVGLEPHHFPLGQLPAGRAKQTRPSGGVGRHECQRRVIRFM
jgi:hypothetical protein